MNKKILLLTTMIVLVVTGLFAQLPVNSNGKSPFVNVVKKVRTAVVNIRVESTIKSNVYGNNLLPDNDFFKFFRPQIPRDRKMVSMGSGFIFKRKGNEVYIVTNNHVVENADKGEITVSLADKEKYIAEVVGKDQMTDLAVIKIKVKKDEKTITANFGDSDSLEVGDWAIAIGNPFGKGLDRTVTVGVISAKGRSNLNFGNKTPIYQDYIQTDAAINPGNSGGPLLNIKGEVIGINAAITTPAGGNVGIGFAIPINIVKKVTTDLMKRGKVLRGYMGILPQELDASLSKTLGLKHIGGVLIAKVEKNSPAETAKLKKGDVILKFNDKDIENVSKFRIIVANSEIGVKLPIVILRDKKIKKLKIVLEEYPANNEVSSLSDSESSDLGIKVCSLDSDYAKQNHIKSDTGVVVCEISEDSPARNSGLDLGDVILEVNRQEVSDISDYNKIMKKVLKNKNKDGNNVLLLYVKSRLGINKFIALTF